MRFKGKRVLVYGMGSRVQSACKRVHSQGACVCVYDDENRCSNIFNYVKEPLLEKFDLVVVSPGIKVIGNPIITHFLVTGTLVISELDLGYLFTKGKIIGITGTNGKTFVTTLTIEIFKAAGYVSFSCGNIGLPLSAVAM